MGCCECKVERGIEMTATSKEIINSAPEGQDSSQDKPMNTDESLTENPILRWNFHPLKI